ncbi:hypothetical protein PWT90_00824 [Aphanocladium album]|nr:hypothetical protein PWT90_00824 [Aphanocladium album]
MCHIIYESDKSIVCGHTTQTKIENLCNLPDSQIPICDDASFETTRLYTDEPCARCTNDWVYQINEDGKPGWARKDKLHTVEELK